MGIRELGSKTETKDSYVNVNKRDVTDDVTVDEEKVKNLMKKIMNARP